MQIDGFSVSCKLEDVLVVSCHHIFLDRSRKGLQRLVRFTLGIVVLHIVEGRKCGLDGDVPALVAGVVD